MVKHRGSAGASAYDQRVEECLAAVAQIARRFPGVESLRDVTAEQWEAARTTCRIPFAAAHAT